jgi:hypothetical protein
VPLAELEKPSLGEQAHPPPLIWVANCSHPSAREISKRWEVYAREKGCFMCDVLVEDGPALDVGRRTGHELV